MKATIFIVIIATIIIYGSSEEEIVRDEKILEEGKCGDGVYWTYSPKEMSLTISGSGIMEDFDSSKSVPWYDLRDEFDTVFIERGVLSVGSYAFSNLRNLKSVVMARTVTDIGKNAFMSCPNLSAMEIPDSVISIGDYAFYGCSSLERVTIPTEVCFIPRFCFSRCTNLQRVDMSSGKLTLIASSSFAGCSMLREIDIPRGVETIADHAFYECSSLASVYIPSSVTTIEENAFELCISLFSITYRGLTDPGMSDTIFKGSSIPDVCVPLNYEQKSFCGLRIRSQLFIDIDMRENSCFEIMKCSRRVFMIKKEEAVAWEERTNGCNIFNCNNRSGLIKKDACQLDNPLSACYLSKCQSDGTCKNTSLYDGTVGGCVLSVECDPKKGWVETKKNCQEIILGQSSTPIEINSETASCYDFTCSGNGTCSYSPKATCGKVCDSKMVDSCKDSGEFIRTKGCIYSRCVEVLSNNLWTGKCQHDTISVGVAIDLNKCYEQFCNSSAKFETRMKREALRWEMQSNECFEYHCDIDAGLVSWSKCNSTKEVTRMCSAGTLNCIEFGDGRTESHVEDNPPPRPPSNTWTVVFDIDSNSTDFNLERFVKVVIDRSNLDPENLRFGTILDESGVLESVYFAVEDETYAQIIVELFNDEEMENIKSAHIERKLIVSKASQIQGVMSSIIIALVMIIYAIWN